MRINKMILISAICLTACQFPPPGGPGGLPSNQQPNSSSTTDTQPDSTNSTINPSSAVSDSNAPHVDVLDTTHLQLGDGRYTTSPQSGYVYVCNTQFNGGGPTSNGPWINGDDTWDATKKYFVDGSITWPHSFTISIEGNQRVFTGNDLPDHTTGTYPISSNDDAYQVDRNPHSITAQNISFGIPVNPETAAQTTCVTGEVGIMLSGVLIFSSFDAEGRDALAHEVQDSCGGHPQQTGFYHYHSLSDCLADSNTGHSALMGYAFDGFGIYGYYGADGVELTNADLDSCHGHTHAIEWDGQTVEMYHYHATREFPYVVGCFRGTPSVRAISAQNGGAGGNATQNGTQPQGQGGSSLQIPQAALDACVNSSQGAACSFTSPTGQVNGSCILPPNSQQLACAP